MTVDVYATMHNEAPLVPYWLRHYERLADRIFVWEDQSTDGTRALLRAHPKVTLRPVQTHGIDDEAWVVGQWDTYRTLSRGLADWVLVVDADEFIYHPALLTRLAQHAQDGAQILKLDGYHMMSDHFPTTAGQIYEEVTTGVRDFFWCHKPCVFSPAVDLQFAPGRHHLKHASAPVVETDIKLLHFRFLGEDYCRARSARNMARMSARNIKRKFHKPNRPDSQNPYSLHWYQQQRPLAQVVVP